MKRFSEWLKRYGSFIRTQTGSVLPVVAISIVALVGTTGMAIDMSRIQIVQSRMQNALDAAGLAVGSEASTVDVQAETNKYFYVNFPTGYMGSTITNGPTATPNANNSMIDLSVQGKVNTTFMKMFAINSVNVSATSQVTRQSSGMELVLVLDNTGSMLCDVATGGDCDGDSSSKIVALKNAVTGTNGLLDILYGSKTTIPNLWIGVVPFAHMVNIGTGHSSWMDTTYNNTLDFGPSIPASTCPLYTKVTPSAAGVHSNSPSRCAYTLTGSSVVPNWGPANWMGCIKSRSATTPAALPYDSSDDIPSGSGKLLQAFNYVSDYTSMNTSSNKCSGGNNPWNCRRNISSPSRTVANYNAASGAGDGPNLDCVTAEVLTMTKTKGNVVTLVNSMVANGSTMINLGMAWGWRMLSPKWVGLWGGEMNSASPQLPLPYHTPLMNKVLILMTDGKNDNGSGAAASAYQGQTIPSNATLDSKTQAICTQLKNNGVIIYTIGFGSGSDVNTTLLSNCASSPSSAYYFLAPTNTQLKAAFKTIGDSLANLYLSH